MQLFFADDIQSDFCTLSEEESTHCVKVLRLGAGDTVSITDGRGTLCHCHILDPHHKHCTLQVDERISDFGRHSFSFHLAVAPTKNSARMEWLMEKAVEMGVDRFTPIVCQHSERAVIKRERLEKIAVSAIKQSQKAFKPLIDDPTPLATLLHQPFDGQKFIAYCNGDLRVPLRDCYTPRSNALILIGPEGDFSDAEVQEALASGFNPVTLGQYRLRTETAALAATAFFNLMNGD